LFSLLFFSDYGSAAEIYDPDDESIDSDFGLLMSSLIIHRDTAGVTLEGKYTHISDT
jgi:hypothetical protein